MPNFDGQTVGRISIKVTPNLDGFRRELRKELEEIERSERGKVTVDVDADTRGVREKIEAAAKDTTAHVNVDVDRGTLDRFQKNISNMSKVKLDLDREGFNRTLAEAKAIARQADVKLNVDIKDAEAEAKLAETIAKLKAEAALAHIKLKIDVDTDQARNTVGNRLRGMLSKLKPSLGSGINLGGYIVILTAIAAVLAPLLGLITTTLLAIPGLVALIATPIAAVALGMEGFAKAAEVLKKPFDGLKKTMSDIAQQTFTPVFEKLTSIFPSLERTLPSVTLGLRDIAKSITDTVTSADGMRRIETTISNIGAALSKAAPGFGDFTDGLLKLSEKFSEKMPDLAGWFNGAMKSFNDWITRITSDGSLDQAFKGLGDTLKLLLDSAGDWLKQGFEFIKDPEKMKKFLAGLQTAANILSAMVYLSDQLYQKLQLVMNIFSDSVVGKLSSVNWSAVWSGLGIAFDLVTGNVRQKLTNLVGEIGITIVSGMANAKTWFRGIVEGAVLTAGDIMVEVATWPGRIAAAIGGAGDILKAAGKAMMSGFKKGLEDGLFEVLKFAGGIAAKIAAVKGPLPYDRTVLVENGKALMQGLGTGIEQGFQGVLEQAKGLAARIQEAMDNGSIKTDLGIYKQQYQRQMDAIKLERQQLQLQMAGTDDKGQKKALQDQLKQLSTVQQTLTAQSEQLRLTDRYGGALGQSNNIMGGMLSKMTQMAQQFGQANAQQAMSDLGISGQGALPQLANLGVGYMSQMLGNMFSQGGMGGVNIQVNSVDEALAARQNIVNKQALRYDRR